MQPGRVLERAAAPVAGISAAIFAALSAARRKRIFHPRGVCFEGTVQFRQGTLLPFHDRSPALARFSRGLGLPKRSPDVLGLAVRFLEIDQDLLLVTSGESSVSRHLLIPATGFFRRPYSSVLPYDFSGNLIVFGGRADPSLVHTTDQDMDDLGAHVAAGRMRFDLTWGPAGTSRIETFASLVLEKPYEGDVVFNPYNSHPDIRPTGALNRLRRDSYPSSQRARPDTNEVA